MAAKDIHPIVWIVGIGAILYFGGFLNLGGVTPTPQTHLACVSNMCSVVSGAGTNECTTVGTTCAPPPAGEYCDTTTTPSVDFLCRDLENKGTSVTCTVHYITTNGDNTAIQTDDDGLNLALDAKDHIEYYINSTGWYGIHGTYDVPCKEEPKVTVPMKDWLKGASTIQLFQEDDGLLVSTTATERVEIGNAPTIKMVYYGGSKDYIQDALFFCEADLTYWDDVLLDGQTGTSALAPNNFAPGAATGANPGGVYVNDKTFGAWKLGDITSAPITKYVKFDSDDTNDAGSTNLANVTCYIEDQDWFIDENKGTFEYGASDENDASVALPMNAGNVTLYIGDT